MAFAAVASLVTFAVCMVGAGRSYSYDESVTVAHFVDHPFLIAFFDQRVANNHPMFSFFEQLVWLGGGTSEVAMRVLPALFAAATVGVVGWWTWRRWDGWASLAATAVLLGNPLFVLFGRSVRGYSLFVLAAVVTTLLMIELVERTGGDAPALGLAYAVVGAIGLSTHLYMLLVLGGHAGFLLGRRQLSSEWGKRWAVIALVAGAVLLNTMPARRAGRFDASFPLDVAWEVTGSSVPALVVLGSMAVVTVWRCRRDWLLALVPLAGVVAIWAVLQPLDLYPRFFVFVVPALALCAARVVRDRAAWVVPVVLVTALTSTLGPPPDGRLDEVAAVLGAARSQGVEICAVGTQALRSYLTDVPELDEEAECDVVAAVGSWEPPGYAEMRIRLTETREIGDTVLFHSPGVVFPR